MITPPIHADESDDDGYVPLPPPANAPVNVSPGPIIAGKYLHTINYICIFRYIY